MTHTFFRPEDGYLADCMPIYHEGVFYIFYLKDYHDKENYPEGTSWNLVCTRDFVHFEDKGEILRHHGKNDPDLYLYTGCVIKKENIFHMFYVSHNPYFLQEGKPRQGICHAVSSDLFHWERCPKDDFFSPGGKYEIDDWRDPFVFWNEEEKRYWMLFAARKAAGPSKSRGVIGLAVSDDLIRWDICEPIYDSGRYMVCECPEIVQIGQWWYLIFSEFSDEFMTRYRMARSPYGPWIEPAKDTFDGRAFYAAKTCLADNTRYLMGWNPTRKGENDYGEWQWGGSLIVHRLYQKSDGLLGVESIKELSGRFSENLEIGVSDIYLGEVEEKCNGLMVNGKSTIATVDLGEMPKNGMISLDYETYDPKGGFGLWIHGTDDFEEGYYFRIESDKRRVVVDMWPRDQITDPMQIAGRDINPYRPGLYQMISEEVCRKGHIEFIFSDTVGVLYINDGTALSTRMYSLQGERWGVFARNTKVLFSNVQFRTMRNYEHHVVGKSVT